MKKVPFQFPEIAPTEVRADITYTGLCHSDLHTVNGDWGPCPYPIAPGHEVIGVVTKIGSEVSEFKIGDTVAFSPLRESCDKCKLCLEGRENLCQAIPDLDRCLYGSHWGGYATAIQQPAKWCFKIPEGLPVEVASPLLCAGITMYAPITKYCKPGFNVAILGIGGLGHLAVQLAHKFGCIVTAFSSTPDKQELIKGFGAKRVVSSIDHKVLAEEASKYDIILNTLATTDPAMLALHLNLTKPGGTFVQIGIPKDMFAFHPSLLVIKEISLVGSLVATRRVVREMLDLCAKEKIVPMIETFQFEDFPKAFNHLEHGRPKFRIVVKCKKD